MKFNFKWGRDNKRVMTPELTEQGVNVYQHENTIQGIEKVGQVKCAECGKLFTPLRGEVTCSLECRDERRRRQKRAWNKKYRDGAKRKQSTARIGEIVGYAEQKTLSSGTKWSPPIKHCIRCGKPFVCHTNRQVFCSTACREGNHKVAVKPAGPPKDDRLFAPTEAITCAICGKEFVPRTFNGKYCSDECRAEQARRNARIWREGQPNTPVRKVSSKKPVRNLTEEKWEEQAKIICSLVESGVGKDVIAKYLKTAFGKR